MSYNVPNAAAQPSQQGTPGGMPIGSRIGAGSQAVYTALNQDLFNRSEWRELYERHNFPMSFRDKLRALGFHKQTSTPNTGHYETDWGIQNFLIGSIVTPSAGAGNNMVVAIDASQMVSPTVAGSALTASYPNPKDVINLAPGVNARIMAKNTTVTPHQFTIRPLQTGVDLDNVVFAGRRYQLIGNSNAEGSDWPNGRIEQYFRYFNEFQTIKTAMYSSGTNLTDEAYFQPLPGTNGALFLRVESQSYKRHNFEVGQTLLFGTSSDNIIEESTGLGYDVNVKHTEGWTTFASTYGHQVTHQPGNVTMQDFYDRANIYEGERCDSKDIMVGCGFRYFQTVEQTLTDFIKDDAKLFTGGGESMEVKVGFRAVSVSGWRFQFMKMDEFSVVKAAGGPGYEYNDWGIYTPLYQTKDAKTGAPSFSMGYEYKGLDGYNREGVVVREDGTGRYTQFANTRNDMTGAMILDEVAFHATCPNLVILDRPQQGL